MALRKRGGVWHYDFAIDGRRYRGTTKESVSSKARMIESALMNDAKQRKLTVQRRTLTLAEFSKRFLDWVGQTRLEAKSREYYKGGWRMLAATPISGMRISHITTDEAGTLRFDHSPANTNRALRTLRRMLGKAAEWGLIGAPPRIKLLKEEGRSALINKDAEAKLLAVAPQPLRDVAILVLDSGMRPSEVFEMRWEDLTWNPGMIFIPRGKTKRSRRYLPMSERVIEALQNRRNGQTEGWVFPSDSVCGHTTSVAKAFAKARAAAGLSKDIVLYSARHSFATKVMGATGDLSLVMRALGHSNAQTAMIYQDPSLETVRSVVNDNQVTTPSRHNSRHTTAD
ncbi:MAG: site-specific recombinase XerD [Edaphobacter sp.]|nr:site-specific recombinase XerD [Edaphobacter sp.]